MDRITSVATRKSLEKEQELLKATKDRKIGKVMTVFILKDHGTWGEQHIVT